MTTPIDLELDLSNLLNFSFVSGTTGFVAPELLAGKVVRIENDLWSFGCTV